MVSSIILSTTALAHETSPSVADFEITDGVLNMRILTALEAIVAGVDLSEVEDTDESAQADEYDALRALSPAQMDARFQTIWPQVAGNFTIMIDGTPQTLSLDETLIPEVGDVELLRPSELRLSTQVGANAQTAQIGWAKEYGTLIVRQNGVDAPFTGILINGQMSDEITLTGGSEVTGWDAFWSYIPVGFDHIIPKGLDHILFVLGLFFFSIHMRPLLLQITAFTLAHTVTLALGALGWVSIPGSIVEPLIAGSIVFVAVENIFAKGLSPWRPVVIFMFGLLHGLGFASVLGDFGLPADGFIPALIGFNVGVEIGQLAVIAIAFLAVGLWFGRKEWYRRVIAIPASIAIAIIAAGWFVERVFYLSLMPI